MRYTDIAIIGGGLAGSTAAAMLGRSGISAVLVDPHPVYPPDFRVEKLSGLAESEQAAYAVRTLEKRPSVMPTFVRSFAYLSGPAYGLLLDVEAPGHVPSRADDVQAAELHNALAEPDVRAAARHLRGDRDAVAFGRPCHARGLQWIFLISG